jgi:cytochrome b pre-mRNA-processing protein 3
MDVMHGIYSRTIRNKYLKDLFVQWRGILAAYDEGMTRGDAVLGAAIWRNIWKAETIGPDGKEFDWGKVASIVGYMRRVTQDLSKVEQADLIFAVGGSPDKRSPPIFGPRPSDADVSKL